MLKYAKAIEEKVVETNKLCTERNKLVQENETLKAIIDNNDLEQKADWEHIEELEEENEKLKSDLEQFSEAYKKYRDYEKEELAESCYDLARENQKLKEEIGKLVMN